VEQGARPAKEREDDRGEPESEERGLAAARAARVNPSFFARGRSSGDPIYPP
jgi:hypothetical protein